MTAMSQLLGDEELQLRSAAAEMLRRNTPVSAFRRLRDENVQPRYDRSLWTQFAELGWTGMLIGEDHGGLAFGHRGAGLVCEEMGRNLVASPYASTCIYAVTLLAHASGELQAQLLPAIIRAQTTVALALDEGRSFRPEHTACSAVREGGSYRLQGHKNFVVDGGFAEHYLVLARTGGRAGERTGLSLFHVPAAALAASARRTLALVDQRDWADLSFADVSIPAAALISEEGQAAELLDELCDVACAHTASELLGIVDALFDTTVEYLKVRQQFGAPIGSFQALQHRASVMFTRIELLRSVVMDALAALDSARDDRSRACSHARATAIDVARLVATEAIQMHGGMGVTDELDVGLYYKRTLTLRQPFGDASYHRERFARLSGY
jgi:alkylation response protein AidB-like acyl-CoA dehydrogenase